LRRTRAQRSADAILRRPPARPAFRSPDIIFDADAAAALICSAFDIIFSTLPASLSSFADTAATRRYCR